MTPDELIGQTFGSYHIEAVLGSGGMAVVYRARTDRAGLVALKVLFPPPGTAAETLARFEREARTAARLSHPGLVKVLDTGQIQGRPYLAMTLIEGQTLAQRLTESGRLAEATAADIAWQIADALYYAHGRGVVHRDIKPSNILLTVDGRALLTDFGVAQALDDPALTRTGFTVGTPAYMSPEQAAGEKTVDGRSDLYSLGVVLYQMVTGRLPFHGGTPQMLYAHVYDLPPPPSSLAEVSPGLEALILRALSKDVTQRFQTGAALALALDQLEDQTGLHPPAGPVNARPPSRNRRGWFRWGSLLILAGLGLVVWQFSGIEVLAPVTTPKANEPVASQASPTPTSAGTPSPTAPQLTLPFPAGSLLKGSGEGVFRLTESGSLQHVYDFPTFQSFGYDQADIQALADDSLADLPLAGELTRLLASPDGGLDWVVQGQRWRIGRWQESLAESGYLGLPPSPADTTLLAALPLTLVAEELPTGQIYREGNNTYGLFAGAELRPFQSEAVVTAYGFAPETSPDIPGEVRHLYRTGPPLTLFLRSDEGQAIFQMVAGQRRPVADEAAVFALGYGIEDIGRMPAEFLDQFPLETPTPTAAPPEPTATRLPPPATEEPPLTPSPTACPVVFDEVFLPLLKAADRATLGCPRAEAILASAASQPFEQGQMLWRGDRKVIYVLEQDGLWSFFGDTWQDGDDPFDPSIIVPEGLFQPVRGFGQVWREQPGLRASLGFALAEERGFSSPIQTLDNALIWFMPNDKTAMVLFNDGTYRVVVGEE